MEKKESKRFIAPEGFEKVSDGTLAIEWDFTTNPICSGVVRAKKIVDCIQQGKPAKAAMLAVEVGDDEFCVWASATLKDLYDDCVIGDTVFIEYDGLVPMGDGRQDMKKFNTAINRTGDRGHGKA